MNSIGSRSSNILTVAHLNIHGQSGLSLAKQKQIEDFIKFNDIDILHCQEINVTEEAFQDCNFIKSSFNIIKNNAINRYGTASLVKNFLNIENVKMDTKGRAILFNINNFTTGNIYLQSGTDGISRGQMEQYCGEVIPQLLVNCQDYGSLGGDFNCIINKEDCTKYPDSKMSPSLQRLVKSFSLHDSFRIIHPNLKHYSRYYNKNGEGATRIDRSYIWGDITIHEATYLPVAFSDHFGYVVKMQLPENMSKIFSPKARPFYKTSPEVIMDNIFQKRVEAALTDWLEIKDNGLQILKWWEIIVKPGIKRIAKTRSKEINKRKRCQLNLLLLRQTYLVGKVQGGVQGMLGELRHVQTCITEWYEGESQKIVLQSKVDDVQTSEKVRIFHHEIHKKLLKKSSILKLDTSEGIKEGHHACSLYLTQELENLLSNPANLDKQAQSILLSEVKPVITNEDNIVIKTPPTKEYVKEVLFNSNLKAAPGTDGLTSLLYKELWPVLGESLHQVILAVWEGKSLTRSQRTSMTVFGAKPKKPLSTKPSDKRRISLLNSDFKLITGVEAAIYKPMLTHILSPSQMVAGDNRRIHHAINKARDCIYSVSKSNTGCAILDLDFKAAFDFFTFSWLSLVLRAKGVCEEGISRVENMYMNRITIPVINNVTSTPIQNIRGSLAQGDPPSMNWFAIGIDPLLDFLEKRLSGITMCSLPTSGPSSLDRTPPSPVVEKYKLIGFADDLKPSVSNMNEFAIINHASSLFERSSGCLLHRDPIEGKCRVLALGRWRNTLQQEDIRYPFMKLSDSLSMLGVELTPSWQSTRKINCDYIKSKVKNTIGSWKSGKHMPLISRPFSLNTYCLSKVWFRASSVLPRKGDIQDMTSKCKSWCYQDMLLKPSEVSLYREVRQGGLGLLHIESRCMAKLITVFIQTAANPRFMESLLHTHLYRYHVLEEHHLPNPGYPPYYPESFFDTIKKVKNETTLNPINMTMKQWYKYLLEENVTMRNVDEEGRKEMVPCRIELVDMNISWDEAYRLSRLRGLTPLEKSNLFCIIHELLPSNERLSRIIPTTSPTCSMCDSGNIESYDHYYFSCAANCEAMTSLLRCLQVYDKDINQSRCLRLDIRADDPFTLPTVIILVTGLTLVWTNRKIRKETTKWTMRAEIEARVLLLRKCRSTRLKESGEIISNILENFYN